MLKENSHFVILKKKLIVLYKFNERHNTITIAIIVNVLMFGIELLFYKPAYIIHAHVY